MAGGQQLPEQYTVPQLARIFHSLPHLNVSLHSVNNTFNPHSEIYLEVGNPDQIINLIFSPIIGTGRNSLSLSLSPTPPPSPFSALHIVSAVVGTKRSEPLI